MSLAYIVIENTTFPSTTTVRYVGSNRSSAKKKFDGIVAGYSAATITIETWRDGERLDNLTKSKHLDAIDQEDEFFDDEEEDEDDFEEEEEEEEEDYDDLEDDDDSDE